MSSQALRRSGHRHISDEADESDVSKAHYFSKEYLDWGASAEVAS
jgi:hypothetical protein